MRTASDRGPRNCGGLGLAVEWPEDEADAETKRGRRARRPAESISHRVLSEGRIPLPNNPIRTQNYVGSTRSRFSNKAVSRRSGCISA
jgi:hypothetical protein